MSRYLLFPITFVLFSPAVLAVTVSIEMTPGLAGSDGVVLEAIDKDTTRFTIRVSTKDDPSTVETQALFVRRGTLEVHGEGDRVLRCTLHPKEQGRYLLYTFDLENEHARKSWFTLAEHFEDGQVGGGSVFL